MLNATINRYAYGTLRPRSDEKITIHSFDYGSSIELAPQEVPVLDGKLDLAKAAINASPALTPADSTSCCIPTRPPARGSARRQR